jgi:NTP pyrophosphatase (non-canonical NTP hydrolase)
VEPLVGKKEYMNEMNREILLITQEECAEVTQAISKVFRFGMDEVYNGVSNREHLQEEIGDLICMLQVMEEKGIIDWTKVSLYASKKRDKLSKWSSII